MAVFRLICSLVLTGCVPGAPALAEHLGPYGAEAVLRGRLLSIAYYLKSIQE